MTVYTLFLYIGFVALVITVVRFFLQGYTRLLLSFLQNFVGTLFVFSGFVKAVDPIGTSIKMHEYFEAMKIEFFNPFSTAITVAMLVAELSLGIALLVGFKSRITTILLLLLNVFFLMLTGYTYISGFEPTNPFFIIAIVAFMFICIGAIFEHGYLRFWTLLIGFGTIVVALLLMKFSTLLLTKPFDPKGMKVTDCGCFGDFMKLKPWQTFYKDVILTFMALILAVRHRQIKPAISVLPRTVITYFTVIASFFFCLYNFMWNEPVIDFRPYAIGEDINANRVTKDPEKKDMIFTYKNKKTGAIRELNQNQLTALTEDDTCLARKDVIVHEGVPARIGNLNVFNEDGAEITDSLLHDPNYTLVVVAPLLAETNEKVFTEDIRPIALGCDKAGIKIYALTKDLDQAEAFRHKNQLAFPFYTTDDAAIKAMMRSNPGLMLIKNGVVINKWHYKKMPNFQQLNSAYFSQK
ncbi:MAG: hypothetical protein JWO03_3097 [Bacteroidetes bacterium]|nr:hypothetical protein [Bacteroidota bacterium]